MARRYCCHPTTPSPPSPPSSLLSQFTSPPRRKETKRRCWNHRPFRATDVVHLYIYISNFTRVIRYQAWFDFGLARENNSVHRSVFMRTPEKKDATTVHVRDCARSRKFVRAFRAFAQHAVRIERATILFPDVSHGTDLKCEEREIFDESVNVAPTCDEKRVRKRRERERERDRKIKIPSSFTTNLPVRTTRESTSSALHIRERRRGRTTTRGRIFVAARQ